MLHAEVRSNETAVHFFGEVNGYNLQTLGIYATQSARFDDRQVRLCLDIDADDESVFAEHWEAWMPRLKAVGATIAVRVRPPMRRAHIEEAAA